jgi:hypothetical protein
MFRRRTPLPLLHQIGQWLWPSAGWRRATTYLAHRVRRLPETPYRIAAGVACGAAISFTPFIGFHFAGAALLALLLRGNVVASALGTMVGNPWTFPFIWAWIYSLGRLLTGHSVTNDLPNVLSLQYIFDRPLEVFWPMTVGGVPTAIVVWFAVFWPLRGVVIEYQRARQWRIRHRARSRPGRMPAVPEAVKEDK